MLLLFSNQEAWSKRRRVGKVELSLICVYERFPETFKAFKGRFLEHDKGDLPT